MKTDAASLQATAQKMVDACRDETDRASCRSCLQQLVQCGKAAVPHLVPLLDQESSNVRIMALDALGRIGDPAAAGAIQRLADADSDPEVQAVAVEALGRLTSPAVIAPLLRALDSADLTKRMEAVRSLVRLRSQDAVPKLTELARRLEATGDQARALYVQAATQYVVGGLNALRSIVNDSAGTPMLRFAAASLLGTTGDPGAVPVLLQCLQAKEEDVRCAAVGSLGDLVRELRVRDTVEAKSVVAGLVVTLSSDWSDRNRMAAASILKSLADPQALPALQNAAAHDPDESTRRWAALAVKECRRRAKGNFEAR